MINRLCFKPLAALLLAPLVSALAALPEAPALQTPAPESRSFLPFPHFTWTADSQAFQSVADPVRYDIQIAADRAFQSVLDEDTVCLNRYIHDRPLPPGTYFWRVRTGRSGGARSSWSAPAGFAVTPCDKDLQVAYDAAAPDHFAAVDVALARARELGASGASVRVVFPKGTYRFDAVGKPLLNLENMRNLILDGTGATILPARYQSGLSKGTHARNVVLMGFAVDYRNERTFLQGRVVRVDEKGQRIQVRLEPGEPDYDTPYVKRGLAFLSLLDPAVNGRLKTDSANAFFFSKIAKEPDGTWFLTLRTHHGGTFFKPGDRFVHFIRERGAALNAFASSYNITCYNMTSYASSSLHYVGIEGSELNVLHCQWKIADGRWFSGNADGVHCRGYAVGPWVEGCDIQAIGDDGIALYARPCCIAQAQPDGQKNACLCKPDFFNLEAGDEVSFFEPVEGRILQECKVSSVAKEPGGNFRVAFDQELPVPLSVFGDQPVKPTLGDGDFQRRTQIWNRSKSCGDFVVRHNTIHNIRRYGTVFRARRGVVEDNAYTAASSSGVLFVNEPSYPNGLYCSDILVRSNTFADCAFEPAPRGPVSLFFVGLGKGGQLAADLGPRRILIESNVFAECRAPEVVLGSARDVVLRGNRVMQNGQAASVTVRETNTVNVVAVP